MLVATSATVPIWTWVFFGFAIFVSVVVSSYGLQRARGDRAARRARRAASGLSPEQKAFQDEMKLMLELRLQGRRSQGADGASGGAGGSAGGAGGSAGSADDGGPGVGQGGSGLAPGAS